MENCALKEEADCLDKSIQHLVKLIEESNLGIPTENQHCMQWTGLE